MRVAIYHPWVYLKSGIERSFVELLRRTRHDWVIYTHHHEPASTYPELAGHEVVELAPAVSVRRSFGPLLHAVVIIARAQLPADGARALLVSSEGLGDLCLFRNRLPAACYCHTPLKIIHDPETRAALVSHDGRKAAALRVMAPPFELLDRRMWRRYRHIFVNSEETLRRVERARLATADRMEVLRPGVDTERFTDDGRARQAMFLVAGRIMWQKNIELAIAALASARSMGMEASLTVAGAVDRKSAPYLARLRAQADGLPVTFEVDPTDHRLAELYRSCLAALLPARNEDWGMVVLEAMASGALVLAVDSGGHRESVVDGETGWLLPDDPSAFAVRMVRTAEDAERLGPMREAARRRAAVFTWERFTERIDDVMEELGTDRGVIHPPGP